MLNCCAWPRSCISLLIVGETGTDQDLAAAALHFWSKRHGRPFLTLICAALPEGIAESELFGHERGAFSGALRDKAGCSREGSANRRLRPVAHRAHVETVQCAGLANGGAGQRLRP